MDVEKVLRYCRFSMCYRGFSELKECVLIVLENEERLLYVTDIYNEVAKKFHLSGSGVERNIRTVLGHALENGGKKRLEALAGCKFFEKPTVSEVIELLACYIKEHWDEPQHTINRPV